MESEKDSSGPLDSTLTYTWKPRRRRPAWPDEPEDELEPPKKQIRDHPLGQKVSPRSSLPALVLLFLCTFFSVWVWKDYPYASLWAASAEEVFGRGQYWRLLTTLFVHADIAHLLANSALFLVFGVMLRQYFGSWAFPFLSLIGGILTSALALLTYPPAVHLIGASGMVYFMAALWLYLFWRHADYLSLVQRSMRTLAFILVVLVPTQIDPQVSYRTHGIGLALGFLLAWMSSPWLKPIPLPATAAEVAPSDHEEAQSEEVEGLLH